MRCNFKIGTIVQAKSNGKSEAHTLQWRVIDIVGNCSGVRYVCECINQPDNLIKLRQDFKESDLEEATTGQWIIKAK